LRSREARARWQPEREHLRRPQPGAVAEPGARQEHRTGPDDGVLADGDGHRLGALRAVAHGAVEVVVDDLAESADAGAGADGHPAGGLDGGAVLDDDAVAEDDLGPRVGPELDGSAAGDQADAAPQADAPGTRQPDVALNQQRAADLEAPGGGERLEPEEARGELAGRGRRRRNVHLGAPEQRPFRLASAAL